MKCPNCNKEISEDYKFCPYCATAIDVHKCPRCGSTNFPEDSKFCPECGCKLRENISTPLSQNNSTVINLDSEVISRLQTLGAERLINISSYESKETPYLLEVASICIICPGKSAVEIGGVTLSNAMGNGVIGYCNAVQAVVIKKVLSLVGVSVKVSVADNLYPIKLYCFTGTSEEWRKRCIDIFERGISRAVENRRQGDTAQKAVDLFYDSAGKYGWPLFRDTAADALNAELASRYGDLDSEFKEILIKNFMMFKVYESRNQNEKSRLLMAEYLKPIYTDAEAFCMYELLKDAHIRAIWR